MREDSRGNVTSGMPDWQRSASAMRRITTSAVAVVAAGVLVVSRPLVAPPTQAALPVAEAERQAGDSTDADVTGVSADPREGYNYDTQTTDVSNGATAEGVRATTGTVFAVGSTDLGSTPEFAALTQAIGTFEDRGHALSLTMLDLTTGHELHYQSAAYYYSASSIKAPFVVSGYETLVDAGQADAAVVDPLAERTLVQSDNDAYLELRDLFGSDAFATWLQAAGVGSGYYDTLSELAETHYPHLSTDQMAAMWRYAYPYLSSGGESAEKIVSYLRQRQVSPIKEALGDSMDTWSKAGWIGFSAEGGVEPATWDAGIVLAPSGTYVLAVGSDAPAQLDALVPIVTAADAVHAVLVD